METLKDQYSTPFSVDQLNRAFLETRRKKAHQVSAPPALEVSPFIIFLDSCPTTPSSSCPTTPSSSCPTTPSYSSLSTPIEEEPPARTKCLPQPIASHLEQLLNSCRNAIKHELPKETLERRHRAVLNHLYYHPVTIADVKALVPEFNVFPYALMAKMATNIGLYYAYGMTSKAELEAIYEYLILQASSKVNAVFERVKSRVAHFQREFQLFDPAALEGNYIADEQPFDGFSTTKPPPPALIQYGKVVVYTRDRANFNWHQLLNVRPTKAALGMHEAVEKTPAWAKTKGIPSWLYVKKKNKRSKKPKKPVVCLPPNHLPSSEMKEKPVVCLPPKHIPCPRKKVTAEPSMQRILCGGNVALPLCLSSHLPGQLLGVN